MRERGGDRVPTFKYGAPGPTAKQWKIAAALDTKRFRSEHRDARLETLAGESALFPYGTYLHRVQHGAQVAELHPDAWVTAPGMTLDEVKAELADGECARVRALELVEIRNAFRDEAGDIIEVEDVEFVRTAASVRASPTASTPASITAESGTKNPEPEPKSVASRKTKPPRPGPRVRHRFTRGTTDAEQAGGGGASRVVVLRDRRRGRPKKSSDPPD